MKHCLPPLPVFSLVLVAFMAWQPAQAEKYAGEFLYLGVGARPMALGNAYAACDGDLFSLYYNPAGLASIHGSQAAFMHSETFGSLLNQDFLGFARRQLNGVAMVSLYRLGGGGILVTEEHDGIFRVRKVASHADYVFNIGYSQKGGSRLSYGAAAKFIYRKMTDWSAKGIGLDAGITYQLRRDLSLALVCQDLTGTILSYSTGREETVNPTAKVGIRAEKAVGKFSGLVLVDGDIRFEGRSSSAQFYQNWISLDTHLGFELCFADRAAARIGSDVGNLTVGVGVKFSKWRLDLALLNHRDLDASYRGSLIVDW